MKQNLKIPLKTKENTGKIAERRKTLYPALIKKE